MCLTRCGVRCLFTWIKSGYCFNRSVHFTCNFVCKPLELLTIVISNCTSGSGLQFLDIYDFNVIFYSERRCRGSSGEGDYIMTRKPIKTDTASFFCYGYILDYIPLSFTIMELPCQDTSFLNSHLFHSSFRFSSLCFERQLVCDPRSCSHVWYCLLLSLGDSLVSQ